MRTSRTPAGVNESVPIGAPFVANGIRAHQSIKRTEKHGWTKGRSSGRVDQMFTRYLQKSSHDADSKTPQRSLGLFARGSRSPPGRFRSSGLVRSPSRGLIEGRCILWVRVPGGGPPGRTARSTARITLAASSTARIRRVAIPQASGHQWRATGRLSRVRGERSRLRPKTACAPSTSHNAYYVNDA